MLLFSRLGDKAGTLVNPEASMAGYKSSREVTSFYIPGFALFSLFTRV